MKQGVLLALVFLCLPALYTQTPGTLKWAFETGGGVYSSPAIGIDGTVNVGSLGGKLYALLSESAGLADSHWPNFHHDIQNTGNVNTTTVISHQGLGLPQEYALWPVYPNPFNPQAHVKFTLPKAGKVKIEVYNFLGQKVATLLDAKKPAGVYELSWDASAFASGLYIIRMEAGSFVYTRRCLLIK